MEPRIIAPDEGRRVSLYEVAFRYGVESTHTDGALAILEVVIPPGTLVKPHRHSKEDEYTLVLEGTVGVRLGDRETEVSAGTYLIKPRQVPHAMWNTGDVAARIAEILVPGGLEDYFEELGPILHRDDDAADADYDALAARPVRISNSFACSPRTSCVRGGWSSGRGRSNLRQRAPSCPWRTWRAEWTGPARGGRSRRRQS